MIRNFHIAVGLEYVLNLFLSLFEYINMISKLKASSIEYCQYYGNKKEGVKLQLYLSCTIWNKQDIFPGY